jgi:hypothetical protein
MCRLGDVSLSRLRRTWVALGKSRKHVSGESEATDIVKCHEIEWGSLQPFCANVIACVKDPDGHYDRLDAHISRLLSWNLEPSEDDESIIRKAQQILARLPQTPPPIQYSEETTQALCDNSPWPTDYLVESSVDAQSPSRNVTNTSLWNELQATRFVSGNTLRIALLLAVRGEPSYFQGTFPLVSGLKL